jgi:hypothetical protein
MNPEDKQVGEVKTDKPEAETTDMERRSTMKAVGLGAIGLLAGQAASAPAQAQGEMGTMNRGAMVAQRRGAAQFIASRNVSDLRQVRIAGLSKPFEELTISELAQLRPGGNAEDSWTIEGVGSDISVSGSSILANLARARGEAAVQSEGAKLAPGASIQIEGQ